MTMLVPIDKKLLACMFGALGLFYVAGIFLRSEHPDWSVALEIAAIIIGIGSQFLRMPAANRVLLAIVTLSAALATWVAVGA